MPIEASSILVIMEVEVLVPAVGSHNRPGVYSVLSSE